MLGGTGEMGGSSRLFMRWCAYRYTIKYLHHKATLVAARGLLFPAHWFLSRNAGVASVAMRWRMASWLRPPLRTAVRRQRGVSVQSAQGGGGLHGNFGGG